MDSTTTELKTTAHARWRKQQRGISDEAIRTAIDWGREFPVGNGRTGFFLGRREVRLASLTGDDLRTHARTVVIVDGTNLVVTTYRASRPRHLAKRAA